MTDKSELQKVIDEVSPVFTDEMIKDLLAKNGVTTEVGCVIAEMSKVMIAALVLAEQDKKDMKNGAQEKTVAQKR